MKYISRSEELLLMAVLQLKDQAYGVPIREYLMQITGKEWAFGALFVTLDRMSKKGLLTSCLTEPTPERGGRSKRIYQLTPDALEALREVRDLERVLWAGDPDLSPDKLS